MDLLLKKDMTPGWSDSLGIYCDACGKTGARVDLRIWCRTPRGPLKARGEFRRNLARKAIYRLRVTPVCQVIQSWR